MIDGYILISPDCIDSDNSKNYHIFEAQKDEDSGKIYLKSKTSICGNVSVKYPVRGRFSNDLEGLTKFAIDEYGKRFCGNCAGVVVYVDY
ncbi:MAG: hypothetical protein IJ846_02990 [Alphaproteobacteria bacterium]|nr:hypothetical protein [Alphaproteobacteria bacterium]